MQKSIDVLEAMVSAMVSNPGAVNVTSKVDEMGVLLLLKVDKEDMGKVIGKAGETAKALRTIIRVVGMNEQARVNLKIEEPEGSTYRKRDDFQRDNLSDNGF
jgi:predicted RNA-binding protein YlqC (UPF0109 family)